MYVCISNIQNILLIFDIWIGNQPESILDFVEDVWIL